jgi:FtsZ-interacting cell division protein YlmF
MSNWWNSFKDAFYRFCDDEYQPPERRNTSDDLNEIMGERNSMRISPQEKPSHIAVVIPESTDEEWRPADYIKTDRPVIVNFKKLDDEEKDQVRNFLIGVIYALDGTFTKLSDDLYLFAPRDVGIITKHDFQDSRLDSDFFAGNLNPEDLL